MRFAGRAGRFAWNRSTYLHRSAVCATRRPSARPAVQDRNIRSAHYNADACRECGDAWPAEYKVYGGALCGILVHLATDRAQERVADPGGLEAVASAGEYDRGIGDSAPERAHERGGARFVPLNR